MPPSKSDLSDFVYQPPAASPDLAAGQVVGEYVIADKLGQGGMGVVYAGQQPVIGKKVAIKVLSADCARVPDLVRRFVEEARAVNKIGHPNIIDIFSFGQLADGRPYFVMEYLEGESLEAALQRRTLDRAEWQRLLRQICGALAAAHEVGILHRDLKPDNIWIGQQKNGPSFVKLLDFGIAKLVDAEPSSMTQTGAALGTPHYMAPEQCLARALDLRVDIYALGVILYRAFTGVMPFDGTSLAEIAYRHVQEAPVPPSQHRPVEPGLEQIILDCLQKDPNARPASARVLGDRLDAVFGGPPRSASPVGVVMPPTMVRSPSPLGVPTTGARAVTGVPVADDVVVATKPWWRQAPVLIGVVVAVVIAAVAFGINRGAGPSTSPDLGRDQPVTGSPPPSTSAPGIVEPARPEPAPALSAPTDDPVAPNTGRVRPQPSAPAAKAKTSETPPPSSRARDKGLIDDNPFR